MNSYVRKRAFADARLLESRWRIENEITHEGMRGRFRELLVQTILTPWLPQYAACGTGMIVDANDRRREATQEDIIIYDRTFLPPILAAPGASEGVFPIESVLAKIEVKTTLTRGELRKALVAAHEINTMDLQFRGQPLPLAAPTLFAFGSDLREDQEDGLPGELRRLTEVALELKNEGALQYNAATHSECLPLPISALCVLHRGMWTLTQRESQWTWSRIRRTANGLEEVVAFIAQISDTVAYTHVRRQGRDPESVPEGRIQGYIMEPGDYERLIVDSPQ